MVHCVQMKLEIRPHFALVDHVKFTKGVGGILESIFQFGLQSNII